MNITEIANFPKLHQLSFEAGFADGWDAAKRMTAEQIRKFEPRCSAYSYLEERDKAYNEYLKEK